MVGEDHFGRFTETILRADQYESSGRPDVGVDYVRLGFYALDETEGNPSSPRERYLSAWFILLFLRAKVKASI